MRVALFYILFSAVAFFNVAGLPANITFRALSPDLIVRYALTEKEMEVMDHVTVDQVASYGSVLGSDSYYVSYIQSDLDWYWPQRTKVRSIDAYILNGNFNECPYGIIILRQSLYTEPFGYGNGSIYRLPYNPIELAKEQGYKPIYSNSEIECLVRE